MTGIICDYGQNPYLKAQDYQDVNSVTVQRWITKNQEILFRKLLKPVMDMNGGYLVYEIDDLMFDGTLLDESKEDFICKKYGKPSRNIGIPKFNRGRKSFEGREIQENIKSMLNLADFVIVTTDYLREIYHDLYDVPMDHIIALPNLLPRYLFDDRYDIEAKVSQFQKNKSKPRIGIVSSLSHFNVDGTREDRDGYCVRKEKDAEGREIWKNELGNIIPFDETNKIVDDFDEITDCIRKTVNDFRYVFLGYCPPQMDDLAKANKIEVHSGAMIYNYPSALEKLNLQAIIAPIRRMEFNFSKSFIKYMECAAIGVPLFATNCLPYDRIMKPSQLFNGSDDLMDKLTKLKFSSTGSYRSMIEQQWKWLNSPCHEGDFDLKNFWLEDNMDIWDNLMKLRPKTRGVSMGHVHSQIEKIETEAKNKTIYKNDSGVCITR